MRLNLKSTNYELNAEIKKHIEDKFGKLNKYFNNIQQIEVEVGLTRKGQQKGKIFFCEVNVSVPKKLLRFRKEFENMVKAINEAKKGIQMEIKKYKEKMIG